MVNASLMRFKDFADEYGHLTPIESNGDIPFEVKRVYYITRVEEGVTRGYHSHRKLHQVLLCVNGSVKIRLKTPQEEEYVTLDDPANGLYIGPMVWREMSEFSPGAVLLVLASEHYDKQEYIREYEDYLKEAEAFFNPTQP